MSQNPMSSQAPASRTGGTQLVVVAGVVALLAVILMNVYVEMRASASALNTQNFFKLRIDRDRGDALAPNDVEMVAIPVSFIRAFGNDAIKESNTRPGTPSGGFEERTFSVTAKKGEIIRFSMFIQENYNRIESNLKPGQRLFALPVSTENQPPNLSADDFVDVYANVNRRSGSQSILIMERVQVRNVGNQVAQQGQDTSRTRSVAYGSITIEVAQAEIPKLNNLQTRIAGNQFIVVVRGASDNALTLDEPATVNPEVLELLGLD